MPARPLRSTSFADRDTAAPGGRIPMVSFLCFPTVLSADRNCQTQHVVRHDRRELRRPVRRGRSRPHEITLADGAPAVALTAHARAQCVYRAQTAGSAKRHPSAPFPDSSRSTDTARSRPAILLGQCLLDRVGDDGGLGICWHDQAPTQHHLAQTAHLARSRPCSHAGLRHRLDLRWAGQASNPSA